MTEKKISDAQLKASRRWQEKNKEQMKHVRNRSGAKGYIKNASLEELAELEQLITKRKKPSYSNLSKRAFCLIVVDLHDVVQLLQPDPLQLAVAISFV
nr:hypothetical protein [Enterococcus innesii]